MARANRYNTRQGGAILSFLASLGDRYVTADEIAASLAVGLATVYRHLDKLERGGKVRKLVVDGVSGACYQYVGDIGAQWLHLMCEDCGKLTDLDCDEFAGLESHILSSHRFRIDAAKTVLYGKCESCGNLV